eukprot:15457377-Alexandrium_andersonii.AAC.1
MQHTSFRANGRSNTRARPGPFQQLRGSFEAASKQLKGNFEAASRQLRGNFKGNFEGWGGRGGEQRQRCSNSKSSRNDAAVPGPPPPGGAARLALRGTGAPMRSAGRRTRSASSTPRPLGGRQFLIPGCHHT